MTQQRLANFALLPGWLLLSLALLIGGCQDNIEPPTAERLLPKGEGVVDALNDYFLSINALTASPYEVAYQDLNGDRLDDALVLLQGPDWCGLGGCPLLIFQGMGKSDFIFLSRTERVRQPVLLGESRTNGWRDLVVGATIKGQPEDMLLHRGLEGYPSSSNQGKRMERRSQIRTVPAF